MKATAQGQAADRYMHEGISDEAPHQTSGTSATCIPKPHSPTDPGKGKSGKYVFKQQIRTGGQRSVTVWEPEAAYPLADNSTTASEVTVQSFHCTEKQLLRKMNKYLHSPEK